MPYVREEQQKRLRSAERSLAMLGRVNPLALEEFTAMEERHKFLTEQLEDLKKTRKDLLDIVREVDARVEQVFTEAYADVSAAFDSTFTRLFPGGEGRLVLTDPDDMLNTGIEVEARPAGKKVKRLSLLSGGERSLVAVAFLVALFKARPSPFYILDEVEAALDDTNLGRLLEIYEELRETSQLLVITHQKRTMEVGDALYGVTMRGDGVSAVISQRLREAGVGVTRCPVPKVDGMTQIVGGDGGDRAPGRCGGRCTSPSLAPRRGPAGRPVAGAADAQGCARSLPTVEPEPGDVLPDGEVAEEQSPITVGTRPGVGPAGRAGRAPGRRSGPTARCAAGIADRGLRGRAWPRAA